MSLTCKHCDCDNFREELMGNAMMVSNEGNCKNCQHPVNAHPRSNATQQQPLVAAANVVSAAVVTESDVHMSEAAFNKGNGMSNNGVDKFGGQQQGAPMIHHETPYIQHPLPNVPLDHSGSHIPQYDPKNGGYVTGTGSVANNETTQGNYNNHGMTGPGVNGTAQSTGSVAYGGAYNSQYEGGYYSAKRTTVPTAQEQLPSSSAPVVQTVDVKVVSSSNDTNTTEEFDYSAVRAQYGSGYSAKR